MELVRDIRFQEALHRPKGRIVPDISANQEAPDRTPGRPQQYGPLTPGRPQQYGPLTPGRLQQDNPLTPGRLQQDDPLPSSGQKRSRDQDPDDEPPSKRTRSQVLYHQTMFAVASNEPQNILADIQAAIIRLENQDRDPAILVSALLASVEAY